MKYELPPQILMYNSIPLRILCTAPSTLHAQYILRVRSSCMNALTHTISREIPKLTFCVATSICISSKLHVRREQVALAQCTALTLHVKSDARTQSQSHFMYHHFILSFMYYVCIIIICFNCTGLNKNSL